MSAAERERVRASMTDKTSYHAGVAVKCAVCVALIGVLALIGAAHHDGGEGSGSVSVGMSSVVAP